MGIVKTRFSAQDISAQISQHAERSSQQVLKVMREEAETIAKTAREFAPVDHGDLEQAIKVFESRDGMNGRTTVTVGVDPNAYDEKGHRVATYAVELHEGQSIGENNGSYAWGLGEKSADKDAGRGVVGGKFMERALRTRIGVMGKRIAAIAAKAFG